MYCFRKYTTLSPYRHFCSAPGTAVLTACIMRRWQCCHLSFSVKCWARAVAQAKRISSSFRSRYVELFPAQSSLAACRILLCIRSLACHRVSILQAPAAFAIMAGERLNMSYGCVSGESGCPPAASGLLPIPYGCGTLRQGANLLRMDVHAGQKMPLHVC